MNYAHLFEAGMLVCFGFSWPLNVVKAYKARTAKGTSLAFIFLIITGYIAGITAKIINHQFNYVLAVYFLNLAIVMVNIFVYFRNKKLDRNNNMKKSKNIIQINAKQLKKHAQKANIQKNPAISLSQEENYNEKNELPASETICDALDFAYCMGLSIEKSTKETPTVPFDHACNA